MVVGQVVMVEVYGGETVRRVVSQLVENKVVVVTEHDYENSEPETLFRIGVGYATDKVFLP